MHHGYTVADELREELIEENLWATEDCIDWEEYDPDDLDSDTRYEVMYEFGLEHSTSWAEEVENWAELIRVVGYSDEWDVLVVGAGRDSTMAMRTLVIDMVHATATIDIESPNCGDTTNTPTSSNK